MTSPDDAIAALIQALRQGDASAGEQLFALLYREFHAQAHRLLRRGPRQTWCTTELVNETWLRLRGRQLAVENRAHYVNLAAKAMRQVLIDHARERAADKRGQGQHAFTLGAADEMAADEPVDLLALDRVMRELEAADPALAELAELHLFAGLGMAEIAELRGVSERTVFRDWRTARMFLIRFIEAQ
jgi:RNA polymerase sigma factor (TIGR02999 family)